MKADPAAPRVNLLGFTAADARIPGRDVLLDETAMKPLLAKLLGTDGPLALDAVELRRAKYRPGERMRALYCVHMRDGWRFVSSRTRPSGAEALYREARQAARPCPPLRGVAYHPGLQTVFWTFPNDRRLRQTRALSPDLPLFTKTFPGRRLALDVAGYSPERAVICRVLDSDSRRVLGFAKAYADGAGEVSHSMLDALHTACHAAADSGGRAPRIPRMLGYDRSLAILLIEALPGAHLSALHDGELDAAFVRLGASMSALHSLPVPRSLPVSTGFGAEVLAEAADIVATVRPDLAGDVFDIVARLVSNQPAPGALVWTHGDLNSRNWLLHDGQVGLIDFDQAVRAPACADLGGVLAWMRGKTLVGQWTLEREDELVGALLEGYGQSLPVPRASERLWYRAAALLVERAARAVTRVRGDQLAVLPAIVSAAATDAEACRHA